MTEAAEGGVYALDGDPFETLAPLVTSATVRIHTALDGYAPGRLEPRPLGSGFFVAPNWVLSCAHVALGGGRGGREVGLSFGTHTVRGLVEWAQPEGPPPGGAKWPAPDLALIRVLQPVPHSCVWLTDRTSHVFTRKRVAFFGYTEEDGEMEAISGSCAIRGELGTDGQLKLSNDDEIPEGVSGGPLLDLARGEVIGVVKARRTAGRDGGLAVSVVQLRRLPTVDGPLRAEHDDLYQRVLHAHDRHHADRHRDDHARYDTWTDVQGQLPAFAARALTPGQRVELLGLLAELPPPVSTRSLAETVTAVLGRPYHGRQPSPRGWRDGLGLLYDLRQGRTELEAVLRYAVHAASAERPYPADPEAERRLWEWASGTAARAQLPRVFRNALGDEWDARRTARPRIADRYPVDLLVAPNGAEPDHGPDPSSQPYVLLELVPRAWERERFDWRLCVTQPSGELIPVDEGFGAPWTREPAEPLRAALREAFRRCDEPHRPAPLQVALDPRMLDLPVDAWHLSAGDGQPSSGAGPELGAQRPVVVRCFEVLPEEDEKRRAQRQARWERLHRGPVQPDVLDCADGRPAPLPSADLLAERSLDALPVLCRPPESEPATAPLRQVLAGGHDVVLWRRDPVAPEENCADLHRGVTRTAAAAGSAGRLPEALWRLRAHVSRGTPEAYWSTGLALLYGDPRHPLPGADQPLETP